MELFDAKGCLSEEGLQALVGGQLDETQRLEAAEHLAYCDRCMDRYTALLTDDADIDYWELYDIKSDPNELHNIYGKPGTQKIEIIN